MPSVADAGDCRAGGTVQRLCQVERGWMQPDRSRATSHVLVGSRHRRSLSFIPHGLRSTSLAVRLGPAETCAPVQKGRSSGGRSGIKHLFRIWRRLFGTRLRGDYFIVLPLECCRPHDYLTLRTILVRCETASGSQVAGPKGSASYEVSARVNPPFRMTTGSRNDAALCCSNPVGPCPEVPLSRFHVGS